MMDDPFIHRVGAVTVAALVVIFAMGAFLGYVPIPDAFVSSFWLMLGGLLVPLSTYIIVTLTTRPTKKKLDTLEQKANETQAQVEEAKALTIKVSQEIKKNGTENGSDSLAAQQDRADMVTMNEYLTRLTAQLGLMTATSSVAPPPPTIIVVPVPGVGVPAQIAPIPPPDVPIIPAQTDLQDNTEAVGENTVATDANTKRRLTDIEDIVLPKTKT